MPKFVEASEEELDALFEDGGLNPNTTYRWERILKEFFQFVESSGDSFDEIKTEPPKIERSFVAFLNSLRVKDKVTGEPSRPKDSYFEFYKSMLKCALKPLTGFNFDDSAMFPKLGKGCKAIKKDIKR